MAAAASGLAHQVAAQAQHAAGAVLVVAFQIGGDLAQLVVLAQRVDERIVASDGVDLALPQHFAEQVLRILAPVHLIGIQAQLRHADGEEVLHRAGLVRHGHAPALQIPALLMGESAGVSSRMQPPCVPTASLTSKPCSSGLSQRSAMPMPPSAWPVAMASSS